MTTRNQWQAFYDDHAPYYDPILSHPGIDVRFPHVTCPDCREPENLAATIEAVRAFLLEHTPSS